VKRKQGVQADDSDDDSSGSDINLIDVDFDFFDPNPDVDFQALKRLIIQLFQTDAEGIHSQELADLILSQPHIGSTVKTDGKESDPYAIVTVLNLHTHEDHPSVKALMDYALLKTRIDLSFHSTLEGLFSDDSSSHIGFIFSERLINMPIQVVPHMYRLLMDELQTAVQQNQPFKLSHFLFISRTYKLSPEEELALNSQTTPSQSKKRRAQNQAQPKSSNGVYSFHHEDTLIQQLASHSVDFDFTNTQPREQDAFGLNLGGRMMLVSAENLTELVKQLTETFLTT